MLALKYRQLSIIWLQHNQHAYARDEYLPISARYHVEQVLFRQRDSGKTCAAFTRKRVDLCGPHHEVLFRQLVVVPEVVDSLMPFQLQRVEVLPHPLRIQNGSGNGYILEQMQTEFDKSKCERTGTSAQTISHCVSLSVSTQFLSRKTSRIVFLRHVLYRVCPGGRPDISDTCTGQLCWSGSLGQTAQRVGQDRQSSQRKALL